MAENEIPDVYIDQMRVTVGVFGVNITFSLSEPHPVSGGTPRGGVEKVRVRMCLEHAKVAALMLRRQIKQYEEQTGTRIQIPGNVFTSLGIPEEDW